MFHRGLNIKFTYGLMHWRTASWQCAGVCSTVTSTYRRVLSNRLDYRSRAAGLRLQTGRRNRSCQARWRSRPHRRRIRSSKIWRRSRTHGWRTWSGMVRWRRCSGHVWRGSGPDMTAWRGSCPNKTGRWSRSGKAAGRWSGSSKATGRGGSPHDTRRRWLAPHERYRSVLGSHEVGRAREGVQPQLHVRADISWRGGRHRAYCLSLDYLRDPKQLTWSLLNRLLLEIDYQWRFLDVNVQRLWWLIKWLWKATYRLWRVAKRLWWVAERLGWVAKQLSRVTKRLWRVAKRLGWVA